VSNVGEDTNQTDGTGRVRRVVQAAALMIVFLGGGAAIAGLLIATRVEPPRTEVGVLPPVVEVVTLRPEDVTEQFVGYGTAEAERTARVSAEVAGNVVELVGEIREGDAVAGDQPLIRLDDREYALNYDRAVALAAAEQAALDELQVERAKLTTLLQAAESELKLSESERNRVTRLFEQEQAAKQEYDFARIAYQQALRVVLGYDRELAKLEPRAARLRASKRSYESAAALARLNVERCVIRAPFAGSIDVLEVDVGDRVQAGSVLLTLVDRERVEVPLQLPAASYASVSAGSECILVCESARDLSWEGTIDRVAPVVNTQTRTYAAYVTVDNARQRRPLVPGTFVRARVSGRVLTDRWVVPRRAIRDGAVFVADDGTARRRPVETALTIADRAVVAGEFEAGDRLILTHLDAMADGAAVRTTTSDSAIAASDPPADAATTTDRVDAP